MSLGKPTCTGSWVPLGAPGGLTQTRCRAGSSIPGQYRTQRMCSCSECITWKASLVNRARELTTPSLFFFFCLFFGIHIADGDCALYLHKDNPFWCVLIQIYLCCILLIPFYKERKCFGPLRITSMNPSNYLLFYVHNALTHRSFGVKEQ